MDFKRWIILRYLPRRIGKTGVVTEMKSKSILSGERGEEVKWVYPRVTPNKTDMKNYGSCPGGGGKSCL